MFALWYGGSGHASASIEDDLEVMPTLKEARNQFERRYTLGSTFRCMFHYADGRDSYAFCPLVDETSEMQIFLADPREMSVPYPDRIIKIGPRRGIRVDYYA